MESNQEDKASKAQNIVYVALIIGLIAIGLSGWIFYTTKYMEDNKPKTIDQKVDTFFEKQDQEFDKIFDKDTTNEEEQ